MSTENPASILKRKSKDLLGAIRSMDVYHSALLRTYLNPYIRDLENFCRQSLSDSSLRDLQKVLANPMEELKKMRGQYRMDVVLYLETRDPVRVCTKLDLSYREE